MSTATAIDLSKVPVPSVIEVLSFEQIFAEMAQTVRDGVPGIIEGLPDFDETMESDPAVKMLQVAAYYRMLDRQRVNDAALDCMVAYAKGDSLINLALIAQVTPLAGETEDELRARIVLAPDGFSVAGPEGAYRYHTLAADADVADAKATSPTPANVTVSVLSKSGTGAASGALLAKVAAALNDEEVRPLTDHVTVQSAAIVDYTITAAISTYAGPDKDILLAQAAARLNAYVASTRKIGRDVTRSGIFAALHVAGVQNVVLTAPAADILISDVQAANCTGITLTWSGVAA